MSKYQYAPEVRRQIEAMLKQALSFVGATIRLADLTEDFGGIDIHYRINDVDCQVRARFDRPHNAQNKDITFRATEPAMITAGTYAPLMLFVWFWNGDAKAAHLIDPYAIHNRLKIDSYELHDCGPRGRFYAVPMTDVYEVDAWLRTGGPDGWHTISTGGLARAQRLLINGVRP